MSRGRKRREKRALYVSGATRDQRIDRRRKGDRSKRVAMSCAAVKPLSANARARRLTVLSSMIVIFAVASTSRLYQLQSTEHQRWLKMALQQHTGEVKVSGSRGTVWDSAGRTLAVSVPTISIGLHPPKIRDREKLARTLAPLIDEDAQHIAQIANADKPFVWLKRGLPFQTADEIRNLGLGSVSALPDFVRSYPQGSLAAPVLGRVGRDGNGQSGVELVYEQVLSRGDINLKVRRDARGAFCAQTEKERVAKYGSLKRVRFLERDEFMPEDGLKEDASLGEDWGLRLTIDTAIQGVVEQELERGLVEAEAARLFGLVMDSDTGEILALAQTKSFDPNEQQLTPDDLRNVVIQDLFEPGSTVKPLIAARAIDKGLFSPKTMMDCEDGQYRVGNYTVRDVHPVGKASVHEAIVRSSNVCMSKIGEALGKDAVHEALRDFGFGQKTGLELPGEARGILRSKRSWATIDVATHSFGHGFSVTAVQLARAFSSLANGGWLVTPSLVASTDTAPRRRVISEETADKMFDMLVGVTTEEHGTAKRARINGITVAGKTGTAQKPRKEGRGYDPDSVISSFIGFIDGREVGLNRKLTMVVVVDEPQVKPRWGGVVAAPVFSKAMERIVSHLMTTEPSTIRTALRVGRSTRGA